MNLPLVVLFSLSGLAMGAATLAGVIPRGLELPLWAVIAVIAAILIGRSPIRRRFLSGFLTGFLAWLLSLVVILLFFDAYLKNNPSATQAFSTLPPNMSPRLFLAVLAPIIAICYGLVIGVLSMLAGKLVGPRAVAT